MPAHPKAFQRIADQLTITAVPDRTTLPELHHRIVDRVTTAYPDLQPVADDLGHLMLAARDQHIEQLEQRIAGLEADVHRYEEVVVGDLNEANTGLQRDVARAEAAVARVRQAVDAGPVGSCCAHLIHAALNPPTAPGHSEGAAGV